MEFDFGFQRISHSKTQKKLILEEKYVDMSIDIFKFPTPSPSIYIIWLILN